MCPAGRLVGNHAGKCRESRRTRGFMLLPLLLLPGLVIACGSGGSPSPATSAPGGAASGPSVASQSSNGGSNNDAATVASQFLTHCDAGDIQEAINLVDPNLRPDLTSQETWGKSYGYMTFACATLATCIEQRFNSNAGCYPKEVKNISGLDQPRCEEASPAEAANGMGEKCTFHLRAAWRQLGSNAAYMDGDKCVIVQKRSGTWYVAGPPTC